MKKTLYINNLLLRKHIRSYAGKCALVVMDQTALLSAVPVQQGHDFKNKPSELLKSAEDFAIYY